MSNAENSFLIIVSMLIDVFFFEKYVHSCTYNRYN